MMDNGDNVCALCCVCVCIAHCDGANCEHYTGRCKIVADLSANELHADADVCNCDVCVYCWHR